MNTFPQPTTLFSSFGDFETAREIISNSFVLGMQRKRSNPPHPSNFGKADIMIPWNSCAEQVISGMITFSPKPACTSVFRSATLQGTCVAVFSLRHTILTDQLCPLLPDQICPLLPVADFLGCVYGAKLLLCSATILLALSAADPKRCLIECPASSAWLQEASTLWLAPVGRP